MKHMGYDWIVDAPTPRLCGRWQLIACRRVQNPTQDPLASSLTSLRSSSTWDSRSITVVALPPGMRLASDMTAVRLCNEQTGAGGANSPANGRSKRATRLCHICCHGGAGSMLLGRLCALPLGFRAITGEVTHLLAIPTLGLRTSNFGLPNGTKCAAAWLGVKHALREPSCSLRRRHGQAPYHACGRFRRHLGPKHCHA